MARNYVLLISFLILLNVLLVIPKYEDIILARSFRLSLEPNFLHFVAILSFWFPNQKILAVIPNIPKLSV